MSLSISLIDVPKTRKRHREEESVDDIAEKLSRADRLTTKEARRLFLETDKDLLQQGLDAHARGSLKAIYDIHKKAKIVCDPAQRKDRFILRMVNKFPETVSIASLLSNKELTALQKHLEKRAHGDNEFNLLSGCRVSLIEGDSECVISTENVKSRFLYTDKENKPVKSILKSLFEKAMEAAFKLDGEASVGEYEARLFILRTLKPSSSASELLKGLKMHHDFAYDAFGKPSEFPKYLFLGMLSDRNGKQGWEGGDLIVQNDHTSRAHVTFQEGVPYLRYEYPLNEGICVRNKEVIHQVTHVTATNRTKKVARDLLIIHLFEADKL